MVTEIVTHNSRLDKDFDTQLPLLVPRLPHSRSQTPALSFPGSGTLVPRLRLGMPFQRLCLSYYLSYSQTLAGNALAEALPLATH